MARIESNTEPTQRNSKLLTDAEVEEVLYGMPFADERYEHEVMAYLKEMIACITTGDEEDDYQQIKRYAALISAQQESKEEEVVKHLKHLREEYFLYIQNGATKQEARGAIVKLVAMASQMGMKGTFLTVKADAALSVFLGSNGTLLAAGSGVMQAGNAIVMPFAWAVTGLIYIAETGFNYRKLKKGEIDKKEFKRRAVIGAIAKVGGLLGTSVGAACGFLVGTAIAPGIGTIIGVIVGGISGSITGQALTLRSIAAVEGQINRIQEI